MFSRFSEDYYFDRLYRNHPGSDCYEEPFPGLDELTVTELWEVIEKHGLDTDVGYEASRRVEAIREPANRHLQYLNDEENEDEE